ncbi:hypothetical protein [Amycolatopsis lurida]|nr:hypothetical protein [Amycolatopsis lurida]
MAKDQNEYVRRNAELLESCAERARGGVSRGGLVVRSAGGL